MEGVFREKSLQKRTPDLADFVYPVREESFSDVVGEVEFRPLFVNKGGRYEKTGFILPVVNGNSLSPVSRGYTVVRTEKIVKIVKQLLSIHFEVIEEKLIDVGRYHKYVLIVNRTFDFDEIPFEEQISRYIYDFGNIFDYDFRNKKDIVGVGVEIYNSYCGFCSLFVVIKVYRLVCSNGLIVGEKIDHLMLKHNASPKNIIDKLNENLIYVVEDLSTLVGELLPYLNREISFQEAFYLLEKAKKLGLAKKNLEVVRNILDKLEYHFNKIKLWWILNLITYFVERSKTILRIPTTQYNLYKKLLEEVLKLRNF